MDIKQSGLLVYDAYAEVFHDNLFEGNRFGIQGIASAPIRINITSLIPQILEVEDVIILIPIFRQTHNIISRTVYTITGMESTRQTRPMS